MFRNRKRQDTLPTSSNAAPSAFHFPSSNGRSSYSDGSGAAIHMEAPVARAWKKASTYTKWSYYALFFCIFLIYIGYRFLRSNHSAIHLICHTTECTFKITPRGRKGTTKITFPRHQLIGAEAMKVTQEGDFVELSPRLDNFVDLPQKGKGKNKKKTTSYKGPDQNNHYPSYRIILREMASQQDKAENEQTGDSVDGGAGDEELSNEIKDSPLTLVKPYMDKGDGDNWTITIRKHEIVQSRRKVKTTVQKIDSYIKRRRHKLTVKENTPPSWQGILSLVLGIFGLLLVMLIGQFVDEEPKRHSGPGTRTKSTPDYKGMRPSKANPRSVPRKAY